MKAIVRIGMLLWAVALFTGQAGADAPYLAIFGENAENKVYHFYIDESEGGTDQVNLTFWPNTSATEAQVVTTINQRDNATLDDPDWNGALTSGYWRAYSLTQSGSSFTGTLSVAKCGSYDIRIRFRDGAGAWQWYAGRNPVVNISDIETRDLVVYEMQAHVVNASDNTFAGRGLLTDLTNTLKNFNVDYLASLGVNCIWLQPFHPIGAHSDCNTGDPASPYSIKNLFQVAEYLSAGNSRTDSMRDFTNFVISAEAKGVKVIFDVIFNHVATDVEIDRDPNNPTVQYSNPTAEMRNVIPQWFSRYVGAAHPACMVTKPADTHANYQYTLPATSASEIGPAPADRHDFVWPDAFDLFWGVYPALGNINDTSDGTWTTSADVKKMVEYYAYFLQYWIEKTGGKAGGFRCDFAQGVPRQAWQYLVNKAKSIKPELYFVSESLDGGNIAYRAWKGGFDALNENQLWQIVEDTDIQTTDLRAVFDARKQSFGYALILRGTMNHDQGPWLNRKWDAAAMHSVFCAMDGTPQMYQGQELGYDALGQFSRERVEFGRTIPDIRNWHNYNNLWANKNNYGNDALWHRYKDANLGRDRSIALRLANNYYIDQVSNWGPHQNIFSVLKYEHYGWDPDNQEVVLAVINLKPNQAQSGTFNVNVPAIYLDPAKSYNVRNLASTTPNTKLWPTARTGADIAANGIYVAFSGNVSQEGSIAQYLIIERDGGGGGDSVTWLGNTRTWPVNGNINKGDELWIDTESTPIGAGDFGSVVYSTDGVTWNTKALETNGTTGANDAWHLSLGKFAAGATLRFAVSITDKAGTTHWDNNNSSNYVVTVNSAGAGGNVIWAGATYHWPTNGAITSDSDLWVNIESYPSNTAIGGEVVYSSDNGTSWQAAQLSFDRGGAGEFFQNDLWHVNLGKFAAGKTIQYAVKVVGTNEVWDNNGGDNFTATVNGGGQGEGSIRWVGNTRYTAGRKPELADAGITVGTDPKIRMTDLRVGAGYHIYRSTNLLSGWTLVDSITGAGLTNDWTDTGFSGGQAFYRMAGYTWPEGKSVFDMDELIVRIETYPVDKATNVTVVYSTTGQNWMTKEMVKIGSEGNNDIWEVSLGSFPQGISVQYAIGVTDDQGVSHWDNNNSENFHVPIKDPNNPDESAPNLSYTPQTTTTTGAFLNVALTATDDYDPAPAIYYTLNGNTPDTNSTVYSAPIHVTNDLTIKAIARDTTGNQSGVTSITVDVNYSNPSGPSTPYSTNPTFGERVANGGITIDGDPNDWGSTKCVALDKANDDPRSYGSNWTMHEAPIDLTHIWAAWDDNNLYLAWQYVDVTDIIDPNNAGSAGGGKISNNDGILQWLVLDTIAGAGATNDVWGKKNTWAGANRPDYQVYLAGSLWQGYISRAQNGVFPVDDGGVNYKTIAAAGITVAKGSTYGGGASLWGEGDADDRNYPSSTSGRNFLSQGHAASRDSFYEMSIPLSYLNLTAAQLETSGIAVMVGAGSMSAMDCIPHDEATINTPGVETYNSSFEWSDADVYTSPFARIAR